LDKDQVITKSLVNMLKKFITAEINERDNEIH